MTTGEIPRSLERLTEISEEIDGVNIDLLNVLVDQGGLDNEATIEGTRVGLAPHQPGRFEEMMVTVYRDAEVRGLDLIMVNKIFTAIHESSIAQQEAATAIELSLGQ